MAGTPWLVLAAADAGGWTRFGVGTVVAVVGGVVLRRELLAEGPGPRP